MSETTTKATAAIPDAWLIWSNEHNAWWNPNSAGYTQNATRAGRYTFYLARDICRNANYRAGSGNAGTGVPSEVMVPSPEIESVIRAIPDLLSACTAILEELDDRYDGAPDSKTLWMTDHIYALRAAIAKAGG